MEIPHKLEAEQAVIGAIALDSSILRKTSLRAEDFHSPRHKNIYDAMVCLNREGIPPDPVTLLQKLPKEDCVYLSNQMAEVLSLSNFSHYEQILKELSQKRQIQKICLETLKSLDEQSPDEIASNLRRKMAGIIEGKGGKILTSGDIAGALWKFIEGRYQDRGALSGIASGLKDLDILTDGHQPGDLIILAGRPGKGKSALAMFFAVNSARAGYPVGIISLEMGNHQLGVRTLSSLSGVELWKIRKGILSSQDLGLLAKGSDTLTCLPLFFSFSARDSASISRVITEMVEIHGCRLLILDYIQLAKSSGSKERREREVAEISWILKTSAQIHNIPVIGLAQLNRDAERQDRRPILADLRDSGAIEQDADIVLFLYQEGEGSPLEIIIAKGRNIGIGTVKVVFDPERMRFGDYREEK